MRHSNIRLLITAFTCFYAFETMAQDADTLEIQRAKNGKISFARFRANTNRQMKNAATFLKQALQMKGDDELRLSKEIIDEIGITHQRYQQYYKGIKIENAEYILHGNNQIIETINGDFQDISISSIKPTLDEATALASALNFVNAKKYKWQDVGLEKFIKARNNSALATYYPKGELVIARDDLAGSKAFKLAWKYIISSLEPDNEQMIFVDAMVGNVINNIPLICNINTPCTAQTKYTGTKGITGDSYNGSYRLQESRNNVPVQTLNLYGAATYAQATDFVNTNTNWTSANWSNFNRDQQALDAHWGAEMVLYYWRTVFNRNSIDGNGMTALGYVHFGLNWGNAAWMGPQNNFMVYGDGDGTTYRAMVSLDICGHEFGHGINQFTANLAHNSDESGALNEGFSDIWGASVEHWAAPTKQTWLMNEEVMANTAFDCERNLQNPKDIKAIEHCPDTYHGINWSNTGNAWTNSTVLSHWFYLLSQGGNGTNDNYNNYNVTGITIEVAQKIAYRAESLYLHSSSDYQAARNATVSAAIDLYGSNSCQVISVTDAWYAVGVGDSYGGTVQILNHENSTNCVPKYSSTNHFVAANSTAPNIQIENVSGALLYTLNGTPATTITIPSFLMGAASGFNSTVTLRVRIGNSCAWEPWKQLTLNVCSTANSFAIAPNPSNGDITVSSTSTSSPQLQSDAAMDMTSKTVSVQSKFYQIKVLGQTGNLLKLFTYPSGTTSTNINLSSLANGVYILQIYDNVSWSSQQVVILK